MNSDLRTVRGHITLNYVGRQEPWEGPLNSVRLLITFTGGKDIDCVQTM